MMLPGYKTVINLFNSLSELLFPRICPVCERGLMRGEKFLCSHCVAGFPFSDNTSIRRKKDLPNLDTNLYKQIYSLFSYNKYSDYKKLIYAIKYHSQKELAFYLGQMLGERIKKDCKADCIIPIPLHPKREKTRRYNQAGEIARGVGDILKIEIVDNIIYRKRNNISQTGKNTEERRKNVEDIFELKCVDKIKGKHVLFIDDVITTGATINSCLALLGGNNVTASIGCLAQTEAY